MGAATPTIKRVVSRKGRTVVDMSDSANLYLTPTQGLWFEAVLGEKHYQDSVAIPLAKAASVLPCLLESIVPAVGDKSLSIVDCGPATAEESIRKLRELAPVVSVKRYLVVDVNSRFLKRVKAGVLKELGLPVTTLQHRFEELNAAALHEHLEGQVLLLFGSTGMNYEPSMLARLIRQLCPVGSLISFESLLREDGLANFPAYQSDAVKRFVFGPLWLMGARLEHFDFNLSAVRDRLRFGFAARRGVNLDDPRLPRLRAGDQVWTAFSRRPSLLEHQAEAKRFTLRFDTVVLGGEVVASLGQVG